MHSAHADPPNQEGLPPECPSIVSVQDMWWSCELPSSSPIGVLSLDSIKEKRECEQVVMKQEEASRTFEENRSRAL